MSAVVANRGIAGVRVRGAFTLIEVLVVVAIIALLVAILIPSLSRVRFQAKLVTCKANLHDLGNASTMYAESYRGYFPITPNAGEDSFYALWKGRLLKNPNVLVDPASRNVVRPESLHFPEMYDHKDVDGVAIPYNKGPGRKANGDDNVGDLCDNAKFGRDDSAGGHSYEYNGCYDESSGNTYWSKKHKRTSHYRFFLQQLVLVHDNDDDPLKTFQTRTGCEDSRSSFGGGGAGNNCPQPWDNHGADGMNMMYADGHADFVKKVAGNWTEYNGTTPTTRYGKNASIDRILLRSQKPWEYFK